MSVSLLFCGDFCPHDRLCSINSNDVESVLGDIKGVVCSTDYSIINLECPIIDSDASSILKQGPVLSSNKNSIDFLKSSGFNGVLLANNHFCDCGQEGVLSTIKWTQDMGLDIVGGGTNLSKASMPLSKEINGISITVINCCESEFSIASEVKGGSNPLNPIRQYYEILDAKKKSDYVVIVVHGGIEHFQYPTPRMVETYRFFIDAGADAVLNHHQHCPCGFEIYKGKPIYYGLGNFCFDWDGKRKSIWNLGYMVRFKLTCDNQISSEIIPYRQCDETPTVTLLEGKEHREFNLMMKELCDAIQDEKLLIVKFRQYSGNEFLYKKMLEPYSGRLLNGLYRRGMVPSTINKERVVSLKDFLFCESHFESVKELIERMYNKYSNE